MLLRNFRGFVMNMDPAKLDHLWSVMDKNSNNFLEKNEAKNFFGQACQTIQGGDSLT